MNNLPTVIRDRLLSQRRPSSHGRSALPSRRKIRCLPYTGISNGVVMGRVGAGAGRLKSYRCCQPGDRAIHGVTMLNFDMSYGEFLEHHLEQRPMHYKNALGERLLDWHDLDVLLHGMEPDERRVQVFLNGQIAPSNFLDDVLEFGRTRKRLNKFCFYSLMKSGATLVLNQFENHAVSAKRLCTVVGRFVQQPTSCNAYVSFNGAGSFGKHWDTHDVFAIQLIGKKRWQLFAPTLPLPMSHQTSAQSQHSCPAKPVFDCILAEGDVLYIPRGWWHQVTQLDVASLHLSVGTYPPTLLDYVMRVCGQQLPQLLDSRRAFIDSDTITAALDQVMQAARTAVLDQKNRDDFIDSVQARERHCSEFQTALILDQPGQLFDGNVSLALTSVYPLRATENEIPVNGGRLKLSPVSVAVVDLLNRIGSINWTDLNTQLAQYSDSSLREVVLDLARYEVISITSAYAGK